MKREVTKLACATLILVSLGFGPVWEVYSETPSDAEKSRLLDGVGRLFVWKPESSAADSKTEGSMKEQKKEIRATALEAKKSGEKAKSDREGNPDAGKAPFSFLSKLGKKNQSEDSGPAEKKKNQPASVPAEKKKVTAETAEVEPTASRKPFGLFAGFGKKEKATASPMPAEENKVVKSTSEKPVPVATASSEPVATVSAGKKQEPAAGGSPKKKSFQLFGKRDREEPVLPGIYDGLSGDEALELAMERARAKLKAQKTPAQ